MTLLLQNIYVNMFTEKLSTSNEPKRNVNNIAIIGTNYEHVPKPENGSTVNDSSLEIQPVFRGLKNPSKMEFLGSDDILVLEKKDGTIRRIVNGAMLDQPVLDVGVANLVEKGMLGIAVARGQNYWSSVNLSEHSPI